MLIKPSQLDKIFKALAHKDRRFMVQVLCAGEATGSKLVELTPMTMPGVLQHLKILEDSGLVGSEKDGRVRTYWVDPDALRVATYWIDSRKREIRRHARGAR